MVCNPLYYRELYPYQCRVPIMGWMTMAHVPCFAMAHIDFIKSWLAGLVYWPHAFPLMRIYNGDIHIIYIYISCYPATKTGLGVSRLVMAMSIGEVLYQRAKSGYIKNMPAVECITYIICVCTYIYICIPLNPTACWSLPTNDGNDDELPNDFGYDGNEAWRGWGVWVPMD
jgi:hypothetical protein